MRCAAFISLRTQRAASAIADAAESSLAATAFMLLETIPLSYLDYAAFLGLINIYSIFKTELQIF